MTLILVCCSVPGIWQMTGTVCLLHPAGAAVAVNETLVLIMQLLC